MPKFAILLSALSVLTTAHAIADLSVEAGYMSSSLTNTVLGSASGAHGNGYLVTSTIHVNFKPAEFLLIGFGPTGGYGSQSLKFANSASNSNVQAARRLGADAIFQVEAIDFIKPFIRMRLGKEWLTNTSTGTVSGQPTELVTEYGALYYDLMLGAAYPIFDILSVYAQFGATGGTTGQVTFKSYTVGGSPQTYTPTLQTNYYSGFSANIGAQLSF